MNVALSIILFFLLGLLLHYIDYKAGLGVYRWWYKMTHESPLPEGVVKGFIVNASFGSRLIVASVFIIAEVLLSFQISKSPPLLDLLLGILGLIGLMLGFYLGSSILNKVPATLEKSVDYLDKLEKGEADVKKEITKGLSKAGDMIKNIKASEKEEFLAKAEEEEQEDEKKPDWRDGVEDFLKK